MGSPVEAPLDYRFATTDLAFALRRDRRALKVTGKAPGEMLKGLLTNRLPSGLRRLGWSPGALPGEESPGERSPAAAGAAAGEVVYSALLTPKGRMVTDMRVFLSLEHGYLLDLPAAGEEGAMAHFKKHVPPRLAAVEAAPGEIAVLTLLGPRGAAVLAERLSERVDPPKMARALEALEEGGELVLRDTPFGAIRVTRNGDLGTRAWDVLSRPGRAEELEAELEAAGAECATERTLETLRIEKGRPAFGLDMDERTLPVEAGIQERAIDYTKGCYTGQEVIVRIRDRGQVNKHLRGLLLGDTPVPDPGQRLFLPGDERSVGWVTSGCRSPAFQQTLALAYVGRKVEVGEDVRVGGPDGSPARVRALGEESWVP